MLYIRPCYRVLRNVGLHLYRDDQGRLYIRGKGGKIRRLWPPSGNRRKRSRSGETHV